MNFFKYQEVFTARNIPEDQTHTSARQLMIYDISVNCKWFDTWWQQYSTHLHTNSTQNDTMRQNIQNGTYVTIRICKLTIRIHNSTIRVQNLQN